VYTTRNEVRVMKSRRAVAFAGLIVSFGIAAQDLPEGWGPVGDAHEKYSLSTSSEAGLNGTGLRIVGENADENFGGVGQVISANEYLRKTVKLSGYMRTDDVSGAGGIWLRIDGPDGPLVLDNMLSRGPTGSTEWQEYSAVLRVPADARRFAFGVILSGSGELHADELAFEIVPDDTPVTATQSEATPEGPRGMSF
jgi:hypothetical protein